MERREFIKALAAAAVAIGVPQLEIANNVLTKRGPTSGLANNIRARGDEIIRVSTVLPIPHLATTAANEIEIVVRRIHHEAEAKAGLLNWRSWRTRVIDTSDSSMDAQQFEVVLERLT